MKAEYGISLQITDGQWKKATLTLEESDRLKGETPEEFLTRTASTLEGWFAEKVKASHPAQTAPGGEIVIGERKTRAEIILEGIQTCKDLTVLKSYSLMARQDETTLRAYEAKFAELSK